MSLDIYVSHVRQVTCLHCGKVTGTEVVHTQESDGRSWYPFLESIGYYVPYDRRTEGNNWYGKDMELTPKQAKELYQFLKDTEVYNNYELGGLVSRALLDGDTVVVNADW